MRWCLILTTILWAAASAAQVTWEKGTLDRIARDESRGHTCLAKGADANPGRSYDMTYHRLELFVDPAIREVNGTVTHHFIALDDLEELLLDLSAPLVVSAVVHQGVEVPFTHQNDSLAVMLNNVIMTGQLDSVSITYGGEPTTTGFGSFVQDEHNEVPVIWTLSQPYGAMDWWPCKQDLQDKADVVDMIVTTTAGNKVVSNGLLIEELELQGGHIRFHWRHQYPISYYLIAFAVTNYEVFHTQIDLPGVATPIPMETWAYPEDAYMMQLNAADIQIQMPLFKELFGMYPFSGEKYGHAQFGWGGGMEHQTISFMGGISFELAAHELAHQWFGNKVTCGSWEDIWLNEGFASYLTGLVYDFLAPEYWHGWKEAQINGIVSQPDGSVRVTDTTDVGRIFDTRLSYRKGAFVLHMLRWVMGDEDFFMACRNYLEDPDLAYSSARTSDLRFHLEQASGLDLEGFFADWFHGEGHPMYTVQWSQDASGLVSLTLDQQPSHPSVDFFELPVPLGFSNGSQDTIVVLDHTSSGQSFTFQLPFLATSAVLDPDLWLISGQNLVLKVPESGAGNGLILYPNPVDDELGVFLGNSLSGILHIHIHDASGRLVYQGTRVGDQDRSTIAVHDLPAGSYILGIRSDDGLVRSPFIKR